MEHRYSQYLVAFVDVLGQRPRLRELRLPQNDNEEERTKILGQLKSTAGVILKLRDDFDISFKEFKKPGPMISALSDKEKEEALKIMKCDLKYHGFSDSVAISLALSDDNEYFTAMIGIAACLFSLSSIIIASFARGFPIRGGVEIGPCLSLSETEVYGAALEKAYYLESIIAEYPRIVIGQELYEFIIAVANHKFESKLGELSKMYANYSRSIIATDQDGRFVLDFLNEAVLKLSEEPPGINNAEVFEMIEKYVYGILKSTYSRDEKLYNRYIKLSNYVQCKKVQYYQNRPK